MNKLVKSTLLQLAIIPSTVDEADFKAILDKVMSILAKMKCNWSHQSRLLSMIFLWYFVLQNYFMINQYPQMVRSLFTLIIDMLQDDTIQVRQKACHILSSLISSGFNVANGEEVVNLEQLVDQFNQNLRQASNGSVQDRHPPILGLCSFVYAYPQTFPNWLPKVLVTLAGYLHDSAPVSVSRLVGLLTWRKINFGFFFGTDCC